ncbi:LysR family transcriptional regulator [Alsobacter sp. SYSU M60028]|uniref:LysR family transcriptional regulator n=1 Tax=Alsobacter ponti TaxID=2962936 RepID=A0ABT1LDP9_9HYPH|nr:LysR family transcriptional regulator [Alsobacter ponti]MCP8939632.1 LysR family transcriptional regulator [Alsobacter ponti]
MNQARAAGPRLASANSASRQSMTLHQLQIFCAVAQTRNLTRASKQLGLAQPSISQQVAKLETISGARLFSRQANRMELTDAGQFLLRHAMLILAAVDEAEAGLRGFASGAQGIVRIAGLNSVLRTVLPAALAELRAANPGIEVDVQEAAPAETLDLLYSRRASIGVIALESVAPSSLSFMQAPIVRDPYVLIAPERLALDAVRDPDVDLDAADRATLNDCIQFNFGTQHTLKVEQWYNHVLPHHRVIARCRSYEVAIEMVRAGLGVCLAPALTVNAVAGGTAGLHLYATGEPDRATVAMLPSQYSRLEPVRSTLAALQAAGARVRLPPIRPVPPFIAAAAGPTTREA